MQFSCITSLIAEHNKGCCGSIPHSMKFDAYTMSLQCCLRHYFRQSIFTQEPITSNQVIQSSSAIEVQLILG